MWQDIYSRQPFARSSPDISKHHSAEGVAVDSGQWLSIHLPCKEDFVDFYLSPRYGDCVVEDFPFLEVCVCSEKFEVIRCRWVFEPTAIFDDFLQGDASPSCCSDCTFSPL